VGTHDGLVNSFFFLSIDQPPASHLYARAARLVAREKERKEKKMVCLPGCRSS